MTRSRADAAQELAGAIRTLKDATLERHRTPPGTAAYEAALAREMRIDVEVLDLARRPEQAPESEPEFAPEPEAE